MTTKVPSKDTGIAIAGIKVALTLRRNRNTTETTKAIEISSVCSTSRNEARIVVVRSITTSTSMPAGMLVASCGSIALIVSTISTVLAPGWLITAIDTAGLPAEEPALRKSCTESLTSATSRKRIGASLRQATIKSRYSAAVLAWSLTWICHCLPPSSMTPLGWFALAFASASRRLSKLTPSRFKASGLTSTRTAGSALPLTLTWPTPWICEIFWPSSVNATS